MERMVNSQAAEQDLTALLTETGLDVYYGSTAKGVVAHMVRDAEELQNVRTPKTDTPLEAFAGTWCPAPSAARRWKAGAAAL